MIQTETVVNVADNTWAKTALVIWVPGGTRKRIARIGDVVKVAVKKASSTWIVKDGQVMKAMVVRVRKEIRRKDGTYIRFGDNAVVMLDIDNKWNLVPKWKRIFGPIAREIREKWFKDISNMAEEVI